MYLEVSARCSGKTTRMINQINVDMQEGRHALIVMPTMQFRNFIEPYLTKCDHYTFCTTANQTNKLFELKTRSMHRPIREFYDEFDMVDYVPVSKTGYYCTTPLKYRHSLHVLKFEKGEVKDSMLELIKVNGGKYLNYSMLHNFEHNLKSLPKDYWARELHGTIIETPAPTTKN